MEWSEEEVEEGWTAWRTTDSEMRDGVIDRAMRRVMTRAVELVAARGRTMTAEQVIYCLESVREHAALEAADKISEHIAAQGARIAELERSAARAIATEVGLMSDGERTQYLKGHDDGAEAMRDACWEAVKEELQHLGFVPPDRICERLKTAIEGAVT